MRVIKVGYGVFQRVEGIGVGWGRGAGIFCSYLPEDLLFGSGFSTISLPRHRRLRRHRRRPHRRLRLWRYSRIP